MSLAQENFDNARRSGNDTLTAGAGTDVLLGGAGNDTIVMAGNLMAADQIDGGMGADTLTLTGNYSGGIENFVRFLEDWSGDTFTYYGSMVELWQSKQGNGVWNGTGSVYKAPARHWYYETNFGNTAPPGSLQIAAYLQQQRWYQVY